MVRTLCKTVAFINKHPLARRSGGGVSRFMRFQLGSRLLPYDIAVPFVAGTRLLIRRGMTGATGNFYCGLHEFEEMGFLLHMLRDTDRFVDVGVNIGSYTILAAGVCGATTWCFEPCRKTFERLCENIRLNNINDIVHPFNIAVGGEKGVLSFTETHDTMNHVVETGSSETGFPVTVDTLDALLGTNPPHLIKIDVEGYEAEVIRGAESVLSAETCKAVIMEVGGGKRYGFDERALHDKMASYGFEPFVYDPMQRRLTTGGTFGLRNALFLKDRSWVEERVRSAPVWQINGVNV